MIKPEILAPVGTKEAFIAAINAGANAVFLAGQKFGARAYLNNFSVEEIKEMVVYAHIRNVKVFITINTLTFDNEVESLLVFTDELVKTNIDALIVQDLGLIKMLVNRYPNTEIHASTQVNAHNIHHVKFLKSLGVKRVILARETSIDTIKLIKKEVDIPLEVFIHGALCVSFSGNCLFSSLINKRSGNRGECAQSCRLNYQLIKDKTPISEEAYLLSAKDLMTIEYIGELIDAGVDSFKIEGRVRKYTYVVQAVSSYKKVIDAYMTKDSVNIENEIENLKRVFNREFTKGYMFNETPKDINNDFRPNHMGVKIGRVIDYKDKKVYIKLEEVLSVGDGIRIIGDEDYGNTIFSMKQGNNSVLTAEASTVINIEVKDTIKIGSTVHKTTDSVLEKTYDKFLNENFDLIGLRVEVSAYVGTPLMIKVQDELFNTIYKVSDEMLLAATNSPTTKEDIKKQVNKLGNTPYYFEYIEINTDNQCFIPNKSINEIRRNAIEKLSEIRSNSKERLISEQVLDGHFNYEDKVSLIVKAHTLEQLDTAYNLGIEVIYYDDILEINEKDYPNTKLYKATKRIIEDDAAYKITGHTVINELGLLNDKTNYDIVSDEFLNVTNIHTANLLGSCNVARVTLSSELSFDKLKEFSSKYHDYYKGYPNLELVLYGHKDLMISKYCPVAKNFGYKPDCKLCFKDQYYLQDRQNGKFALINDGHCNMRIMDTKPLLLINYVSDIIKARINTLRLDFTLENSKVTKDIIMAFKQALEMQPYKINLDRTSTGRFLG